MERDRLEEEVVGRVIVSAGVVVVANEAEVVVAILMIPLRRDALMSRRRGDMRLLYRSIHNVTRRSAQDQNDESSRQLISLYVSRDAVLHKASTDSIDSDVIWVLI